MLSESTAAQAQTIATLLAYSGQMRHFERASAFVVFAELCPRSHESDNSSVHVKPRLSKVGHAFLRRALYMPAMVMLWCTDRG